MGRYYSDQTVQKSLKKCGISNARDGTEDDMLWLDDDKVDNIARAIKHHCTCYIHANKTRI